MKTDDFSTEPVDADVPIGPGIVTFTAYKDGSIVKGGPFPIATANVTELDHARALPEISNADRGTIGFHDPFVSEGAIRLFMDDSEGNGRRVMRIQARNVDGVLHKWATPIGD